VKWGGPGVVANDVGWGAPGVVANDVGWGALGVIANDAETFGLQNLQTAVVGGCCGRILQPTITEEFLPAAE
jgi:hypothetical protein